MRLRKQAEEIGRSMYEGDMADGVAIVPVAAVAGSALGLDWLLLIAVAVVLLSVIVYRRRRPARERS